MKPSTLMKPSTRIAMVFASAALAAAATVLGILLLSANAKNGLSAMSIVTVDSTSLPSSLSKSLNTHLKPLGINPDDVSLLLPNGTRQSVYFSDGAGGIDGGTNVARDFFSYRPPASAPYPGTYLKWATLGIAIKEGPSADLTADGGAARQKVLALGDGLNEEVLKWATASAGFIDPRVDAAKLIAATVLESVAVVLLLAVFAPSARRSDSVLPRSRKVSRLLYGQYGLLAGCTTAGGSLAASSTSHISSIVGDLKPGYLLMSEQGVSGFVPYSSSDAYINMMLATAIMGLAAGFFAGFVIAGEHKMRKSYETLENSGTTANANANANANEMERAPFRQPFDGSDERTGDKRLGNEWRVL